MFPGENQYISSFSVILVGVRGDRTRNSWVGSRVFYHWAKSPRYRQRFTSSQTCSLRTTRWPIKDSDIGVLEHLKSSPCCGRVLLCMNSMPLFSYVRRGGGNVTSMHRKNGLRHTPRSYQAPPDVRKSYVSVLACCYGSSFRLTNKVGNTSGLPDISATVAVKTCGACETYVKLSGIILCIYLSVQINDKKIINMIKK